MYEIGLIQSPPTYSEIAPFVRKIMRYKQRVCNRDHPNLSLEFYGFYRNRFVNIMEISVNTRLQQFISQYSFILQRNTYKSSHRPLTYMINNPSESDSLSPLSLNPHRLLSLVFCLTLFYISLLFVTGFVLRAGARFSRPSNHHATM